MSTEDHDYAQAVRAHLARRTDLSAADIAASRAYLAEQRLSERTDLRPLAMAARDVRPGMVLVGYPDEARETVTETRGTGPAWRGIRTRGGGWRTGPADHVLQVLGEEVRGYGELAPGDVVRVRNGWATVPSPETDRVITAPGRVVVRAYVDPEWERAQAEAHYACPLCGCIFKGGGQCDGYEMDAPHERTHVGPH